MICLFASRRRTWRPSESLRLMYPSLCRCRCVWEGDGGGWPHAGTRGAGEGEGGVRGGLRRGRAAGETACQGGRREMPCVASSLASGSLRLCAPDVRSRLSTTSLPLFGTSLLDCLLRPALRPSPRPSKFCTQRPTYTLQVCSAPSSTADPSFRPSATSHSGGVCRIQLYYRTHQRYQLQAATMHVWLATRNNPITLCLAPAV